MENFTTLFKELQSRSLKIYKQNTHYGVKVFYLALDEEFNYLELQRISNRMYLCNYGEFFLDATKNLKYEDTPILSIDVDVEEYNNCRKVVDNYPNWNSNYVKSICENFSLNVIKDKH